MSGITRVSGPLRGSMAAAADKLATTKVIGESGKGLVQATLSGEGRLIDLQVSPAIGKSSPAAIESYVTAAVNKAHEKLREMNSRML